MSEQRGSGRTNEALNIKETASIDHARQLAKCLIYVAATSNHGLVLKKVQRGIKCLVKSLYWYEYCSMKKKEKLMVKKNF